MWAAIIRALYLELMLQAPAGTHPPPKTRRSMAHQTPRSMVP
jgi:hypothetical protein